MSRELRNRSSRSLKNILIGHAPRMVQPGVDDLPLVAPSRAKIQEWGASVLKFAEEFQAIAGGWRLCRFDRLRLDPTVPLHQHLGFPLILSHSPRVPRIS